MRNPATHTRHVCHTDTGIVVATVGRHYHLNTQHTGRVRALLLEILGDAEYPFKFEWTTEGGDKRHGAFKSAEIIELC